MRTSRSTLDAIKTASPKEVVEEISLQKGGKMAAESAGALPRNKQQAYNASKEQKSQDPLYNLVLESRSKVNISSYVKLNWQQNQQ